MRRIAAVLAGVLVSWTLPLLAATFQVTTTQDSADGTCDSHCSLREAVIAANQSPGTDQIVLPEGVYELTLTGSDENAALTGDLDITEAVTIVGAGLNRTVLDGRGLDHVFDIRPGANPVTVSELMIRGGSGNNGGAIHARSGTYLQLNYDAFVGNTAVAIGGAVEAEGSLVVADCLFVANSSNSGMGAIHGQSSVDIVRSMFVGNRAVNGGGALGTSLDQTVTVEDSLFAGNVSGYGGGISADRSNLTCTNVTWTGNDAASGGGGGVAMHRGTAVFKNCTFADNLSAGHGSDVYGSGTDPGVTFENTILVSSGADQSCEGYTPVSAGHNLGVDGSCGLTADGDVTVVEPGLRMLRDNGGPTLTVGLLTGSPAIDAGGGQYAATDQRGTQRPVGSAPDIGAYEADGSEPVIGFPQTVPVIAHVDGVGGTPWRSDVAITNPGTAPIGATMRYTPVGGAPVDQWLTLAPGETVLYEDMVASIFGVGDGRGTLQVLSSETHAPPVVATRTFAESGSERLGQGMPAFDPYPKGTYFIPGLREDAEYRSNIGVAAGDENVTVQIDLYRGVDGKVGSTFAQTVAAGTQQQWRLPTMFPGLAQTGVPMTAEVRIYGEALPYGSLVDQQSADAVTLMAQGSGSAALIPVVAHNPGSQGTFWRSDLAFFNPNPVGAKIYLEYLPEENDNSAGGLEADPIGVPAHATVSIEDVAGTLFGVTNGKGSLSIVAAPGVATASRTYTTRSGGGTYGLGVPELSAWARTGRPLLLTGIREGDPYRTNIGLVGGEHTAGFELQLLDASGSMLASKYVYVEPRSLAQMSVRDLFPGVNWNGFAIGAVRLTSSGHIRAAYSSTVDGSSQDPIFAMATPVR